MPSYEILEQKYLKSYKEDGIVSCDIKIGFLDFLREIKNGSDTLAQMAGKKYPVFLK